MLYRLLLVPFVLVALMACGGQSPTPTPTFARYTIPDVFAAFRAAGLSVENVQPGTPWKQGDLWPNVALERQVFDIAAIAPEGGVVQTFATQQDRDAMAAYYARFPDIAPYVYARHNILVQLNRGLAKAEAEQYRAALEALP
jgi:hypothetical protein